MSCDFLFFVVIILINYSQVDALYKIIFIFSYDADWAAQRLA